MRDTIYVQEDVSDKLREECGVFGMYDFSGEGVAPSIYYGPGTIQKNRISPSTRNSR